LLKNIHIHNIYIYIPKALVSGITQSPIVIFLIFEPAATTSATPSLPPIAPYPLNLGLIG